MSNTTSINDNAALEAALSEVIGPGKGLVVAHLVPRAFIDILLLGVTISQVITYSQFVKTDKKHIVSLVGVAVVCTTAASLCIFLWTMHLFVWNFGRLIPMTELAWLAKYTYIDIITALAVQIVYIDRACRLFRHWWPAVAIAPISVGSTIIGVALNELVFKRWDTLTPEDTDLALMRKFTFGYTWFSLTLLSDLLITCIIVYGLQRIRTDWVDTKSRLRRLMAVSFEAQVPALAVAIISLVTWDNYFEIGLPFILLQTKIYVLGLLITLNLRAANVADSGVKTSYPSARGSHQHLSDVYRMSVIPDRIRKEDAESDNQISDDGAWNLAPTLGNGNTVDPAKGEVDGKDEYGSTVYLTDRVGSTGRA